MDRNTVIEYIANYFRLDLDYDEDGDYITDSGDWNGGCTILGKAQTLTDCLHNRKVVLHENSLQYRRTQADPCFKVD